MHGYVRKAKREELIRERVCIYVYICMYAFVFLYEAEWQGDGKTYTHILTHTSVYAGGRVNGKTAGL